MVVIWMKLLTFLRILWKWKIETVLYFSDQDNFLLYYRFSDFHCSFSWFFLCDCFVSRMERNDRNFTFHKQFFIFIFFFLLLYICDFFEKCSECLINSSTISRGSRKKCEVEKKEKLSKHDMKVEIIISRLENEFCKNTKNDDFIEF